MQRGNVLDGRFELEERAGAGGMGEVFRARDRISGAEVAVKLLLDTDGPHQERFMREASMLADLSHPAIVRYVAHGMAHTGRPYLAMEWLNGEDLMSRLARGPLTIADAVTLGARVASALSISHARGVIHRDLKPSNLFLVDGEVARVTVLDFGIARRFGAPTMTKTGVVLGTPGYMAPEQVESGASLDASADVFALGCVLFECLTGAPVFAGEQLLAVLTKILFQQAPRVSDQRAETPPALDALIARMLAKDRTVRPRDGAAVLEALRAIGDGAALRGPAKAPPAGDGASALTRSERRVLSVVLLGREDPARSSLATTLDEAAPAATAALRRAAEAHGGSLSLLADGSAVVTVQGSSRVATDQAAQAARAALALRAANAERAMVLVTGRGAMTEVLPVGEVIDRAARMLAQLHTSALVERRAQPIAIDEVTAGLLDARFEVVEGAPGFELQGEREIARGARTLLGKPTACVGRDWELGTLEALWSESVEEPAARAVVVTAPAGMGKSRLAQELIERVRRRGERAAIWIGRGDSLRAGSAFGLLKQVLRNALAIQDGEPIEVRREKLGARIAAQAGITDRRRVTEFLGELAGTPFSDEDSAPLRAARQDAQLMGDNMRRAWVDFLRAETAAHPVLIVLEDLHWGDLPTVRFLDAALRDLANEPWMLLSLARPEATDIFPRLWAGRRVQEIRLKELSRKASARLARQVLGEGGDPETIERIVTQAAGHAFYLEELIRAVAQGRDAKLPETVLAMVEARLDGLEGDARRALRAASVFGEVCWEGGIMDLVGSTMKPATVAACLSTLVEQEVLIRKPESKFPGEPELAFRHALLREGAYATLTEGDRTLGHRLAGEWLSRRGEGDAMVLAEHFERGQELRRAASFYLRAAEEAHRGSVDDAIARAARGLQCSGSGDVRLALLALLCEAQGYRDNRLGDAAAHADEVMQLAPPGSTPWAKAALSKLWDALHLGRIDAFIATIERVRSVEPSADAVGAVAWALSTGVFLLDQAGQVDLAERLLARLHAIAEPAALRNPIARAAMHMAHCCREAWFNEDPWSSLAHADAALTSFREANHSQYVLLAQVFLAMNLWLLGANARAERELRDTMVPGVELNNGAPFRSLYMASVLADRGALDEAHAEATLLIETGNARSIAVNEGRGRWARADLLRRQGALDDAEREALAALELLRNMPLDHMATTATLAAIQLGKGRAVEALATAEAAMERYRVMGAFGYKGAFAHLVHAEALHAAGHHERARAAIAAARARLLANAEKIGEADLRRSFLENVPEHVRTFALAQAWLGERSSAP